MSDAAAKSGSSEKKILDQEDEVLFRQVHPRLFDGDEPASSAFMPSGEDNGFLSVDRSSLTTAVASHERYVSNGLLSGGVYGVTVGEFQSCGLICHPDPVVGGNGRKPNLAHSVVDYNSLGTNQRRKAGQRLKAAAINRGILHKP